VHGTHRIRVPVRQRIAESGQRGRLVAVLFADRRRLASAVAVRRDGRLSRGVFPPVRRRRVPANITNGRWSPRIGRPIRDEYVRQDRVVRHGLGVGQREPAAALSAQILAELPSFVSFAWKKRV